MTSDRRRCQGWSSTPGEICEQDCMMRTGAGGAKDGSWSIRSLALYQQGHTPFYPPHCTPQIPSVVHMGVV